jgi:syndecan 1
MTADHGDSAVPGAGPGPGPGRFPSHGEAEGRFDIVVRGYDRRQVDEHIANLERTISRQRTELQQHPAQSQQPRPSASREPVGNSSEKIGEFTGRLKSILEAAEEEAKEIRTEARNFARAEEDAARARLADLERRRDGLMGDLSRVRGNLDALLTRYAGPPAPKTPPEGNPLPVRADNGAPRAEKVPASTSRQDAAKPTVGAARTGAGPGPNPRTDPSGRPSAAQPGPAPSADRPKPATRPGTEENGRPGTAPRTVPAAPATPGGNTPGSTPGGSAGPSPKPRPTPSPRPRATPPSGGTPAGLGQPAPGPIGRGSEQPARNGVLNRDNGTGPNRDDDGGHSAFGSGAR